MEILEQILDQLSDIDPENLTTLEFAILWATAKNPPANGGGIEARITNRDKDVFKYFTN